MTQLAPRNSSLRLVQSFQDRLVSELQSAPSSFKQIDKRVRKVMALLTTDLACSPRLPELAAQVGLCTRQLIRLFQREIGFTPLQYLRRLRLERAHELLMHSTLSVKEIRQELGIDDASNFNHEFKRHFGISPAQLRLRSESL